MRDGEVLEALTAHVEMSGEGAAWGLAAPSTAPRSLWLSLGLERPAATVARL